MYPKVASRWSSSSSADESSARPLPPWLAGSCRVLVPVSVGPRGMPESGGRPAVRVGFRGNARDRGQTGCSGSWASTRRREVRSSIMVVRQSGLGSGAAVLYLNRRSLDARQESRVEPTRLAGLHARGRPSWRCISDWTSIRERYLEDGIDIRLGGLAANLARIGSLSRRAGYSDVVSRLVVESGLFIEWTARDVPLEALAELAELQRVSLGGATLGRSSGRTSHSGGRSPRPQPSGRVACWSCLGLRCARPSHRTRPTCSSVTPTALAPVTRRARG